jgi:chromosomal replication initiation ATPase DnaA
MYLLYAGLGLSLARVARAFGRDRSTAAHACRQIEDLRDDEDYDIWIEQLSVGLVSVAGLGALRETA